MVVLDDELQAIAKEVVRSGRSREKIHLGLDYFDASINRVAAWVSGTRNLLKALLIAFLEPLNTLRAAENRMDFTRRLALFEEVKGLPWASVWDYYCVTEEVPTGMTWLEAIATYERDVLAERGKRQREFDLVFSTPCGVPKTISPGK